MLHQVPFHGHLWTFFSCGHSSFSTTQNPVPFLEPGAQHTSGMNQHTCIDDFLRMLVYFQKSADPCLGEIVDFSGFFYQLILSLHKQFKF